MKCPAAWMAALLTISSSTAIAQSSEAEMKLEAASFPQVAEVDPLFQSYNVEMAEIVGGRFWAPYPKPGAAASAENTEASGGLALQANLFRQRPPADLTERKLLNMARALGPAYIRVSGSWANAVFFQDDGLPQVAKPPKGFQNVLTRQQWAGVVAFAKAVDGKIITSFPVSDGARDASGTWSPDQARKLLRYTREIGGQVYAAELINEPNLGAVSGLPANYGAKSFARDIAAFQAFVKSEAPDLKSVGPGSTGETGVALFNNRGLPTETMLSAEPRARFDIFSYHFYGARSQRCAKMAPSSAIQPEHAMSEEWLARTDKALAYYRDLRDRYMPGAPIWLNETAQASCGGDKWASSFLDTFRYVDQMGRLAKQGVAAVFHNTLAASDYGLIDEATMSPRANYWAALLWRRIMGERVLDTGPANPELHIYAHCLRDRPGGVALAAINMNRARTINLNLDLPAESYTLSADNLLDGPTKLNGSPLAMTGDRLPSLRPANAKTGSISLRPASITFLAVPSANNAACR